MIHLDCNIINEIIAFIINRTISGLLKSSKVFIILHIKPHAKEQSLQSTNQRKYESHCVYVWNITCCRPDIKHSNGQRDASRKQDKRKAIEEDERMKILYHIFKYKPPPEAFE